MWMRLIKHFICRCTIPAQLITHQNFLKLGRQYVFLWLARDAHIPNDDNIFCCLVSAHLREQEYCVLMMVSVRNVTWKLLQ
jgi:hypothetical protein